MYLLEDCTNQPHASIIHLRRSQTEHAPLYTYELQVSLRAFLRFFFSPSAPADAVDLAAFALDFDSALTGAFCAVDAGALDAEEAGWRRRV